MCHIIFGQYLPSILWVFCLIIGLFLLYYILLGFFFLILANFFLLFGVCILPVYSFSSYPRYCKLHVYHVSLKLVNVVIVLLNNTGAYDHSDAPIFNAVIPPTITHRKIYLHVHLTKHVQDLHAENYKFLMKEI